MSEFPFPFFGHRPAEESDAPRRLYLLRFAEAPGESQRERFGELAAESFFGGPVAGHVLFASEGEWFAWQLDVDLTWASSERRGFDPSNSSRAIELASAVLRRLHELAPLAEVVFTGALSDAGSDWDAWSREVHGRPSEVAGVRVDGRELRRDGDAWMNQDDAYDARIRALPAILARVDGSYRSAADRVFLALLSGLPGVEPVDAPDAAIVPARRWEWAGGELTLARRRLRFVDADGRERFSEPVSGASGLRLGRALLIAGEARTDVAWLVDDGVRFGSPIPARVDAAAAPDLVEIGARWFRWSLDEPASAPTISEVSKVPSPTEPTPPEGRSLPSDVRYVATMASGELVVRRGGRLERVGADGEAPVPLRPGGGREDVERLRDVHPTEPRVLVELGEHTGPIHEVLTDERTDRRLFDSEGVRARYLGRDRLVASVGRDLVLYAHDPAAGVHLRRLDERPFLRGFFAVHGERVITLERGRRELLVYALDGAGDAWVERGEPQRVGGPAHMSRAIEVDGAIYVSMGRRAYVVRG